ncbi:AraC family transcriptional regulator [Litoribrevibacter albus]|uniref:AraC family transcriptional regulator n=1 Tax=Litoribrevibacter albus TaxID=1473156 RepID=A0AA37SC07_9GAMM|nr:AraC family transcriptional regulator [Litoribrevibacter albus]GLQ31999.1 AraC family transcriptional regulator [Litoribrevibacter albus]
MLNNLFITSDVSNLISDFVKHYMTELSPDILSNPPEALKEQLALVSNVQHLSFEQWWTLLESLQHALGQPALGLKIGEFVKVEYFGCLGYLLKTSQDLEQALRCFERFQRLLYDGNRAALTFESDSQGRFLAKLIWEADYGYSNQLSDELLISALVSLAREMLADDSIKPISINFTNKVATDNEVIYRDYFDCEVNFGQPNLSVTFPASYFSLPIQGSDQQLHQLMSMQAENLLEKAPNADDDKDNFLIKVRKVLVRALQEGEPTVEAVAEQFHLSTRSLHRRLHEEGVVFRELLKDTRMLLAKQYLKDRKLTLPEVALMLGYSEQSAFSRAFKQWFDETPLQYQKRLL